MSSYDEYGLGRAQPITLLHFDRYLHHHSYVVETQCCRPDMDGRSSRSSQSDGLSFEIDVSYDTVCSGLVRFGRSLSRERSVCNHVHTRGGHGWQEPVCRGPGRAPTAKPGSERLVGSSPVPDLTPLWPGTGGEPV